MSASHTTIEETKQEPALQFPDPDDVLKDFHAAYEPDIIPIIEDYLRGPDGRSEDEFRKVEYDFHFRMVALNKKEKKRVVDWYRREDYKSLKANEPQDCVFQGLLHYCGIIGPINYEDARFYFEKAGCEPLAQALLGYLYRYGEGVEADVEKAKELCLQATKANCSVAWRLMAIIYLYGYKNSKKAAECYQQAARLSNWAAESGLGKLFHVGSAAIPNAQALQHHVHAARQGSITGVYALAMHFYKKCEFITAEKYFLPLAERDDAASLLWLYEIFNKKSGEESIKKAKTFLRKAAELNEIYALEVLGEASFAAKEYKQAEAYFKKSIAFAFSGAIGNRHYRLYQIYRFGYGGIAKNYDLAAFHARQHVADLSNLGNLYSWEHDNPSVCYHAAVAGQLHEIDIAFQCLLNSPVPALNKCYEEVKDTPYLLKAHISEPTVCQIIRADECLRTDTPLPGGLVNTVIEYIGPISPFALQVVKEEKIAKPLVAEMKKVLNISASVLADAKFQRRKMAIEFAEQNLMSVATALGFALEISKVEDKRFFKNLFEMTGMDILFTAEAKPGSHDLIAKTIFEYWGPNEAPVADAKEVVAHAQSAVAGMKTILTSCITLFGRTALNDRLVAIQNAEDKEVSYQDGLRKALGI